MRFITLYIFVLAIPYVINGLASFSICSNTFMSEMAIEPMFEVSHPRELGASGVSEFG